MRKVKKWFGRTCVLLLAVILAFSFGACSSSNDKSANASASENASQSTGETADVSDASVQNSTTGKNSTSSKTKKSTTTTKKTSSPSSNSSKQTTTKKKSSSSSEKTTKKQTTTKKKSSSGSSSNKKNSGSSSSSGSSASTSHCTNNNNHSVACGNIGKWFSSRSDVEKYWEQVDAQYFSQYEKGEITWDEYVSKSPVGYEAWSCSYCGKWTGNFKYR